MKIFSNFNQVFTLGVTLYLFLFHEPGQEKMTQRKETRHRRYCFFPIRKFTPIPQNYYHLVSYIKTIRY